MSFDKKELNISFTVDKNNLEKQNTINKLSNIKNLIITYKKNANNVTQTFNTTINTTQPADSVMMDEYQRAIQRGHSNGNFIKLYE